MSEVGKKIHTPEERHAVFQEFMAAGLRAGGGQIQRWYEQKAGELGVSPSTVQQWVAREKEKAFFAGAGKKATVHQLLAHEIDLTAVDAMLTLKKGLRAKRHIFRCDKEGNVIADYHEKDWQARNQAAEKILKVMGGFSEKIEITPGGGDTSEMTDAELLEELQKIEARTRRALPAPLKTIGGSDADAERELPQVQDSPA